MWEIRVTRWVGKRGTPSREFIARKRMEDGRLSAVSISAILPWNERLPEREQEERCVAFFLQCAKEMAAQGDLPIRR